MVSNTRLLKMALVLIALVCFAVESKAKQITLVLAADMPNITDPESGRYAELKSLLDRYREQQPPVFFVFGGGSIGPSAMSSFDRGSHIIDILNTLEPDVMGVTKREFSYFEDELSLRAYEAAFPIVASNVLDKRFDDTPDGLFKSVIIEKQGVKLGVISLLNERIIEEYLLHNITVMNPREISEQVAEDLRTKGADTILLHYSFPFPFVPELIDSNIIDIAVMSDTRLREKYQTLSTNDQTLLLDKSGDILVATLEVTNRETRLNNVDRYSLKTLNAAPAVQLQVNSYQMRLDRLLDERIGIWKTNVFTTTSDVRSKENLFANFVTDSMRTYAQTDISLLNGGSIRGNTTYLNQQNITRRDITTELPFRSSLVSINLTGKQLLDGLENGLSQVEFLKGGFPHFSGMTVEFSADKPAGNRVLQVSIAGKPLNENAMYSLATTDYLASGGDGYLSFSQDTQLREITDFDVLISDLVIQQIRIQDGVSGEIEGRITNASEVQ
ncbi:5'-nucleotidase C-terminal domain-containing protein [Alteromonas sp. KUL49]|uniref:bifunctional metallophosphatase/5'-nucleotidase n=1 Tax=Alteromonas sp. KUL49 TaxID=2480798 RepID=UPI00102EFFF5|nr:5'-nucleotidase C-terminal domain-containing protein [Alteromonas sp. KUL49]TAP41487.1 bifunctional metallophosphatase/5'-nucleotidase [Alteromonas sp. KUL49]GEA10578.1 multifunctional 2',3'-cyclic-nucleotide 2'-phosphodiesterase/5'-nucleotidase/3'-nucleotidase [Alteromonas sp. KUL49]